MTAVETFLNAPGTPLESGFTLLLEAMSFTAASLRDTSALRAVSGIIRGTVGSLSRIVEELPTRLTGDVVARDRHATVRRERCKLAAEKNLAVRLDDDDVNRAVNVRIETVERGLPAHRCCYQDQQYRRHGEKLGFESRQFAL
jgi:hypothetical protein